MLTKPEHCSAATSLISALAHCYFFAVRLLNHPFLFLPTFMKNLCSHAFHMKIDLQGLISLHPRRGRSIDPKGSISMGDQFPSPSRRWGNWYFFLLLSENRSGSTPAVKLQCVTGHFPLTTQHGELNATGCRAATGQDPLRHKAVTSSLHLAGW